MAAAQESADAEACQIAPGDPITEESLSGELDVSRPILREALQGLQLNQLIERLDNALEQLTVREATPRLGATDLATPAGMVQFVDASSSS
jgi:DNA-binding FadR family transcriptional regulator